MRNCSKTSEQLALMTNNKSQDMGRISLGHIAIRTRTVNFKTIHMPLNWSMSSVKPGKSSSISPTACTMQSRPSSVSVIPLMYGGLPS
ncbi:hypothetical protein TNCV_2012511 [Trichonephila clavipes]|nr:hypothetical protein TNCV_2012511 [Trichonephila clavipes]